MRLPGKYKQMISPIARLLWPLLYCRWESLREQVTDTVQTYDTTVLILDENNWHIGSFCPAERWHFWFLCAFCFSIEKLGVRTACQVGDIIIATK